MTGAGLAAGVTVWLLVSPPADHLRERTYTSAIPIIRVAFDSLLRVGQSTALSPENSAKSSGFASANVTVAFAFSELALGPAQLKWETGTVLESTKKVDSTPRTRAWNVTITSTDVITYQLQIRVGSRKYTIDYTPEIQPSDLPVGWEVGRDLQVRVEKKRLLIRRSDEEITTYIRDTAKVPDGSGDSYKQK